MRDDDGKLLAESEVGEIIIRTPRIMKGYAGRNDDSRLPDGWRATGDLGWVDEEGYVFFAGRKDDMIIRGGENIAPAEIEAVLMSHPAIDEAAVIGVPSVEWGQTVKAFVVKRPGHEGPAPKIQEFCRTRLASFKRPESIEFIEALPKNPLGKILRKELRGKGDDAAALSASRRDARHGRPSRCHACRRLRHGNAHAARARNRLSPAMAGRLVELAEEVEDDADALMLVIRGAGGNFCEGFDEDVDSLVPWWSNRSPCCPSRRWRLSTASPPMKVWNWRSPRICASRRRSASLTMGQLARGRCLALAAPNACRGLSARHRR